ncbi:hypothetical protein [Chryseobacterium sp. SIMBA_029]|uniref:hypothetical protein n=1 Tax=Chryseobacterium sp. SIMBA_029 TaxID=3085772 RepID=UPI00397D3333
MIVIPTKSHHSFEFKKTCIDCWESNTVSVKTPSTESISFEFSDEFYIKNSEKPDFESKLEDFINIYFENEAKISAVFMPVLDALLTANHDIGNGVQEDIRHKSVEIIALHEFKLTIKLYLYHGYTECFITINRVKDYFLVTKIDYNWAYQRF